MLPGGVEAAVGAGGLVAVWLVLVAGLFVGLTPGAYVAGPAVLGYINVGVGDRRALLVGRALAYAVGAAVPMAAFGLLLGLLGDVVLVAFADQVVGWYLLVAITTGTTGLLLTGLVIMKLPSYVPVPRPAASARDAFLLGLPLGLAACPACTPMLVPIAGAAMMSGGPVYAAGLLFLFGMARGVPVVVAAASFAALRRLRMIIPLGLSAQRVSGWLLLATAALYLIQALVIVSGRPALFA